MKPAGQLLPLELPVRKWDHIALDFVVGMPVQDGLDTICTIVDKATKMCHFVPCSESISAKGVAQLYWQHVGKLHGIPSVIISDRDPRFTSRFWKELWRLLGTDLHMGGIPWEVSPRKFRASRKDESVVRTNPPMHRPSIG